MATTEERMQVTIPANRPTGVRWWLAAVIGVVALATGVLIGTAISSDNGGPQESDMITAEEPGGDVVETVEQWGAAWESGDGDAVLALYSSNTEERYMVDQTFRAVWRDVEAAIDQVNSVNDFDRFNVVRIEEFPTSVVAEYQVQWMPEDDAPADQSSIVVVFTLDAEGIVGSDISVLPWVNLFGVDYREFGIDGGWVVVD